jgi:hypothetical protein
MELSRISRQLRLAGIHILHCLHGFGDNMRVPLIQPLKVIAEKKETLNAISHDLCKFQNHKIFLNQTL